MVLGHSYNYGLEMQHGHAQLADVADELLHLRAQQKAQQDEHHAQKDIFAHAAGGADLERELVLAGEGMQGDARRGQHVQHHMADAAQADAQQGGLPVRGHQMAARHQQDGDPPAEPVGGAAVDLVEGALRVAGALGDGLVELVGQDGAETGGDHAFQRQVQGQGGADARRLVGDPFHGSSIRLGMPSRKAGRGLRSKGRAEASPRVLFR